MTEDTSAGIDRQNRQIEQEAQADTDLETVVPPTSPMWGTTTWWRIGAIAVGVILIATAIFQAI